MEDDDDDLDKQRRVLEIFRQRFKSTTVQEHHQTYLNHLHDRLYQWEIETKETIKQFIQEKIDQIDQFYDQYCEDIDEKYTEMKEQIENDDSSTDVNDQIRNFDICCQLNTIENRIRLQTKGFSNEQCNENIQLEFLPYLSSQGTTIEPVESPVAEKESVKHRTSKRLDLFDEEETFEPTEPLINQGSVEESPEEPLVRRSIVRTLHSPAEERLIEPLESPIREREAEPTETFIRRREVRTLHAPAEETPIEPLDSPVREREAEPTETFIRRREVRTLHSPAEERTIEPFESPVQEGETEIQKSAMQQRTADSPIEEPAAEIIKKRTIGPLKPYVSDGSESTHSARLSPRESLVSVHDDTKNDRPSSRRTTTPSKEKPLTYHLKSSLRQITDTEPKTPTRLYVGRNDVLTPVLVGKDREVYSETEKITEYSVDSIPVSEEKRAPGSNADSDDEIKVVRAYRVFIQAESDYQRHSLLSSDQEEKDDEDDEELSKINNKFNLKNFDQINYSTIMFRTCETEYNCMSSSTRRNELLLFNSKLHVLIILQHENHQPCRHRFYLHWPKSLSPYISDITYCQENDQFLISTRDTSRIYLFDRNLLSLVDLGQLSNDSPLRRIHCDQRTIYCIVANNYLLEYQIDEHYSQVQIRRQIRLFNPLDQSQDTCYHLLDITCSETYLLIIYSNEHDEIHLQSIYRQTRKFHQDILLDIRQPINQNYIRIESTSIDGNFLYLNGSQHHLKAIDLVHYQKGKITSIMRRHTKPTNISFLRDQRLVILYEQPYFLSVHDWTDQEEH